MSTSLREFLIRLGMGPDLVPRDVTTAEVQAVCDSAPFEGLVSLLGAAIETGAVRCDAADIARVNAAWLDRMAWVLWWTSKWVGPSSATRLCRWEQAHDLITRPS